MLSRCRQSLYFPDRKPSPMPLLNRPDTNGTELLKPGCVRLEALTCFFASKLAVTIKREARPTEKNTGYELISRSRGVRSMLLQPTPNEYCHLFSVATD